MSRLMIVEDGKVLPGCSKIWKRYVERSLEETKNYYKENVNTLSEDPTEATTFLAELLAESTFESEEEQCINTAYRLGCGSISIDTLEFSKQLEQEITAAREAGNISLQAELNDCLTELLSCQNSYYE